ncbi:NAGLT1 [Mytilus coruscus]|uniref:NAGLT1 n=1 Tax=Mytilus coruscus TaxID=42192 RepID=A0A6J8CMQ5_MYTCO|nr:NAGLT1 [Mytilus coruscus]
MSDSVENDSNTIILKDIISINNGQTEGLDKTNQPSIFIRFRTDTIYRSKLYQTLALSWLSTCLGWNAGQLGPVLPDLQVITNITLDEASYYLTALSLGFLLGALIVGWIFRKGHQTITMSTLTALFAILTAVIPWCKYYVLMMILFLIRGSARGVIDADKHKASAKRRRSGDLNKRNLKKQRSETIVTDNEIGHESVVAQCIETENKQCSGSDINEIKAMVIPLMETMNTFCDQLSSRIDNIESNISKTIKQVVDKKIKKVINEERKNMKIDIQKLEKKVDDEMSKFKKEVKNDIECVMKELSSMRKPYAEVSKQPKEKY